MSGCGCEVELKDAKQKHVLYWLLGINAVMFCVEITVGLYANSTAWPETERSISRNP